MRNPVKEALKRDEVVFGTCARLVRNPAIARMFATAGFQYFFIDAEHSSYSMETIADITLAARGAGIVPLVRVPELQPSFMLRALDSGALGVLVPHVETKEQVELIIHATKYYPIGERGMTTRNAHTDYGPGEEALQVANDDTMVVIMIESEAGIQNIDQLVAVPGVDAAYVGPYDLSQSLGVPAQVNHPSVVAAIEEVIAACCQHGVAPGIHVGNISAAKEWLDKGMRMLGYSTDVGLLMEASTQAVSQLKALIRT